MEIEKEHPQEGVVLLRLEGRADADSAALLKDALEGEAEQSPRSVIVDLAGVDFMDSSGLSALVAGHKALRQAGGVLRISRPNPQAMTALRLTLLDTVIRVFDSVESAVSEDAEPEG